ncbi:MAG: translocation/assembly module TamB domain-containing protein [Aquabacterium sp.]
MPIAVLSGSVSLLEARAAKTLNMAWHDGLLDLQAQTPSAGATQAGSVSLKGGWGGSRTLRADWRGVTPRALHGLAPPLQLSGNAVVRPRWRDGLLALAQTDMDVAAEVQGLYGQAFAADVPSAKAFAPATPVPVSLNLAGRYGPGRVLIQSLRLQSQEARASVADSAVQWGGPVPWAVKLAAHVQDFDPRVWLPWPATVTGAHRVSGKLSADLNARWQGQARLDVAPSVLGGLPLQGQVVWQSPANPQRMSLNADVDVAGNALRVQAELPWRRDARGDLDWAEGAQWHGRIQAPALHQLQAIAPLLGAARIGGVVEGEGSARGLWPDLRSEGRLNVSRFQWDTRAGQAYRLESAQANWQLDTADLQAPTQVRVALSKGVAGPMALEQATLEVDGSLQAHRLKLVADMTQQLRKERKPTPVHAELAGQGGLARAGREKAFTGWDGQISQLLVRTGGLTPHVLLMAQPFRIQGNWQQDGRSVVVSPTSVNVLGAGLDVQKLQWRTASVVQDPLGDLQADVQLNPLNLATVLASWQPQAGWGGDLVLTGKLNLRHSQAQPWVVDADVRHLSGDLSLAEPTIEGNVVQRLGIRQASLTVRARDGRWSAEQQFDGRLFGVLSGQAAVTVADPHRLPSADDALSGALNLQVRNLRPWGTWLPAGWRLSGQMQAQATLGGTVGAPQYAGKVTGQGLGIGQALLGVNITDGELEMTLEGDHLHLTRFEAKSGSQGGSLVATGDMQPAEEGMRTTLNIQADRFGLLQRVDRRVVVSGELQGHAEGEDIDILGKVRVDEGLIDISKSDAPMVGDDVYVVNRPGDDEEEEEDTSSSGGPQRKVNANIEVNLGSKLKLRGRGLDAFLTGALTVTTPSNRPSLRGTIKVENGTYAAYGQKLVIERGSVAFTGPIENPRLDILAMRAQSPTAASTDVKVGVNITGTAQDPRVRLYSDPAMSETEKLSWLVLGRAPTGLGGADIGLLQTAAVALLSGEGSSPSDNLIGKLGLDELSVRQSDGAVRETVVNLGKQVSKYWYVGYERSLNATSGNWQLIYRLAQRFTVRAQAGDDNAIDFIWSWRWD